MLFNDRDHVVFRGDPDRIVYRVDHHNTDGSVDLHHVDPGVGGYHPEFVPERLLEAAPRRVVVGDVYRGKHTGDLYFVVGSPDEDSDGFLVFDDSSLFGGLKRIPETELQDTRSYRLVSEFGLLD